MKALLVALTSFLCLMSRAEWGLVDAVAALDQSKRTAAQWSALWPFHSDETYLYDSITNSNRYLTSEYKGSTVNTSESDWAPAGIYQCQRWITSSGQNASTYPMCTFTNLVPNASYKVTYFVAEHYWSAAGSRLNSIEINGQLVEEKLDLVAKYGKLVACTRTYDVMADATGRVAVKMAWGGKDNTIYGGLAIQGVAVPSDLKLVYSSEDETLTYSAKDALTYTVQDADAPEGPWRTVVDNVLAKDGCGVLDVPVRSYYRLVASNGVGVATSEALKVNRATAFALIDAIYADTAYSSMNAKDVPAERQAALWPFRSDADMPSSKYYASSEFTAPTFTKTTSDWAPNEAYLTQRYFAGQGSSAVSVSFTNLTPHAVYRLDWLGSEMDNQATIGKRIFSVAVNGVVRESNIDLYKEAGERRFVASTRSYGARADADGKVTISLTKTADCAKYGSLALFGLLPPRAVSLSFDTGTSELVFCAPEALLCRVQRSFVSAEGPWEDVSVVQAADGATLRVAAPSGEYFRVVSFNDIGETVSAAIKASVASGASADLPVYAWNLGGDNHVTGRFASADGFTAKAELFRTDAAVTVPTALRYRGVPEAIARQSLKAPSVDYVFPNLRSGKTYLLKTYAEASKQVKVTETAVTPANGEYVLTSNNEKLLAVELVEQASDGTPLKAVARAAKIAGGVAVSALAQRGDTTFEIRRNGETIATGVRRTWIDRAGTKADRYAARAVSPGGKAGEWSDEVTPVDGKEFLGLRGVKTISGPIVSGGKTWEPMQDYWVTGAAGTVYDTTLNSPCLSEYLQYYDDFTPDVLYNALWFGNGTDGIKLCLDGLVPGLTYRVRMVTGDAYDGSKKVGGRIHNLWVNGESLFVRADPYKARATGTSRWYALDCQAVASGAGMIHVQMGSEGDQWPQLSAVSATLEAPFAAAGARTVVEDGSRVLDGWLDVPDADTYVFASSALAEGRLRIDDVPVANGTVALGAGLHRLRFRTPESVGEAALTVASSALAATDVTTRMTHDAAFAPTWGDGSWRVTGNGDAVCLGTDDAGLPVWQLTADNGPLEIVHDGAFSGEISFRVRNIRDYNEHGLALAAFADERAVTVTATENGAVCGTLTGVPVWMKVKVSRAGVTRSVSRDGVAWTELGTDAKSADCVSLGLRLTAPGETACHVEIDRVHVRAKDTPGLMVIVK